MSWRRSLGVRLVLAFAVVSLTGTLLVAAYVAISTRSRFGDYQVEQSNAVWATIWAERYVAAGGWNTVTFTRLPTDVHRPELPLVVADEQGRAVIGGPGIQAGESIPAGLLLRGTPIEANGRVVGTLVPLWDQRPALPANPFMRDFYSALYVGGGAATALALLLGVLLSHSLRRPLQELQAATRAVSHGDLGHQIPVRSRDELGALTQDFNRMSADLAAAALQRRQMTADIAHELRTPLSLILGHAEAIEDGVLPATPEALGIIHDEARSLARLVDDLRTLSLAESNELTMAIQPLAPAEILRRAANTFAPCAAENGLALAVEAPEGLPPVSGDADRVAQVLGNLLSNALRHTPAGGRITLRAEADEYAVRLGVADTGPGIAHKDLPHIFERFYRGDTSRHREGGGTGLGLAIARSLVQAQGGRIWADSIPGNGATLWFTLPTTSPRDAASRPHSPQV